MLYEELLREAEQQEVDIYEKPMPSTFKGLYKDSVIWINKHIPTNTEKACILAEEIGHHFTSVGNILDQRKFSNRKQEKLARNWAYEKLVPLSKIVQAHHVCVKNRYELAEFCGVTEQFLDDALKRYQEKYGVSVSYGKYIIYFEPLDVLEQFEEE